MGRPSVQEFGSLETLKGGQCSWSAGVVGGSSDFVLRAVETHGKTSMFYLFLR